MNLLESPPALLVGWWCALGLFVGSFLNVAIHRLPLEGESVSKPRRSRCPSCKTSLTWKENIPLVSWIVQRGRCRTCRWPIPWRYPLVELLNAALWGAIAAWTLPERPALCLLYSVVLSGLVVATFVDFACFEIPDEISIGGMWLGPIASFLVPTLHQGSKLGMWLTDISQVEVSRIGALTNSLAGLAVGGGILWLIGWVGSKVYGRDAMGFGDVKLLAAGGSLVGPGAVLVALMIAALVASGAGLANMLRFVVFLRLRVARRGARRSFGSSLAVARAAGRYLPFGPYLALGIAIVLLGWRWVHLWLPPGLDSL